MSWIAILGFGAIIGFVIGMIVDNHYVLTHLSAYCH